MTTTAQLNDTANGRKLMVERYDRDLTDVFAGDEITDDIVTAIGAGRSTRRRTFAAGASRRSVDARQSGDGEVSASLAGDASLIAWPRRRCRECAIQIDPDYGQAFARVGGYQMFGVHLVWT